MYPTNTQNLCGYMNLIGMLYLSDINNDLTVSLSVLWQTWLPVHS